MRIRNDKVIDKMVELIKENLSLNDFKRYLSNFPREIDYNIYQYGNLDVYDYDLYLRLKDFGVTTKSVKDFEKVLDSGCTYKHRENLRNDYKKLVRYAAIRLWFDIRLKRVFEKDFII